MDKDNFHAWKFRITNFLLGKAYWEYTDGDLEDAPKVPNTDATVAEVKALKDWNQGSRKVMYWLSISIHDTMIGHIQDAKSPKEAWENLVTVDQTHTRARKIQLKDELDTMKKMDMSVNDYTLKIKAICESLASIGVTVDDDDKVESCLHGSRTNILQSATSSFDTSLLRMSKDTSVVRTQWR